MVRLVPGFRHRVNWNLGRTTPTLLRWLLVDVAQVYPILYVLHCFGPLYLCKVRFRHSPTLRAATLLRRSTTRLSYPSLRYTLYNGVNIQVVDYRSLLVGYQMPRHAAYRAAFYWDWFLCSPTCIILVGSLVETLDSESKH